MIAAFAFLTLAIVALWFRGERSISAIRRFLWLHLFAAAVLAALHAGIVQPLGLVWIVALGLAAYAYSRPTIHPGSRAAVALVFLLLTVGLMTHRLPGFVNPRVISDLRLTSDALPYRHHLNFDKPLIALFFLGFCHPLLAHVKDWRATIARTIPVVFGVIATIMLVALGSGYVRFAPKFPAESWLWLWSNLFLTCLAEETVFRGFILREMQQLLGSRRGGTAAAVGVAAILFGIAHYAGGLAYVALATLAGIGYGWAYVRTRSIEAAVLTHFALNAVHFFGFTYPALER